MKKLIIKRDLLYKAIWKEPIEVVCKKYYLPLGKMKMICKQLNVPVPTAKYWEQISEGKSAKIKELPKKSEQEEWIESISEWEIKRRKESEEDKLIDYSKKESSKIKQACEKANKKVKIDKMHPLVLARKSTINTPQEKLYQYDVRESKEIKERIDYIYHVILSMIEELGYQVKEEAQGYSVIIKEEEISFKIREKAKIAYREPNEDDYYNIIYVKGKQQVRMTLPTGILELKIDCYYGRKALWQDSEIAKLEEQIGDIIVELFQCVAKIKRRKKEREESEQKRKEEEKRKRQQEFLYRPQELKKIFQIGKKVSKLEVGLHATKARVDILNDIIEKIILHVGSFAKLIEDPILPELDISALASIARNIMECSNTYFYYAERGITDEEVMFRYWISRLHYDKNMLDIVKKLKFPTDKDKTQWLLTGEHLSKRAIKESSVFSQLDKNEKSQVLNGNKAYINKMQKQTKEILEKDMESAIYNIFSNSTHSYNLGLGNHSLNGSYTHGGYITSTMLLSFATEISIIYTANVLIDYLKLRTKLNNNLTKDEKAFLKEMTKQEKLQEWLEIQRQEYGKSLWDISKSEEEEEIILT